MSGMRNVLGVDVGGTFTDFVAYDPATRSVTVWKELSTPSDPVTGIIAGMAQHPARDAIASVQIDPRLPVIPVRALKNAGTEAFTAKQREVANLLDGGTVDMAAAQLEIEHYWAGALRRAVIDGDVEHGSLMAGQSVGMVNKEEPVADIIAQLMAEAAHALEKRAA